MTSELRKALLFLGGLLGFAVLAVVFGARLFGFFAGPQVQIVSLLKATERGGLEVEVKGAPPLRVHRHFFERVLVEVEGEAAEAVTTLDLEGTLGTTKVSSLGYERLPLVREGGVWRTAAGHAPRLSAVLCALEARRRALEAGEVAVLARLSEVEVQDLEADPRLQAVLLLQGRAVRAEAWYIRSERDQVLVSEDYRLTGDTPDRPVDERGTRRFSLQERGGEFFFTTGVM